MSNSSLIEKIHTNGQKNGQVFFLNHKKFRGVLEVRNFNSRI